MAQRFGGKYSPDAQNDGTDQKSAPSRADVYQGAKADPAGARVNILFLPPIILTFTSLNDGAVGMTMGLVAAGILVLAAWLLREGLRAQVAYDTRKVAKRPAVPRKLVAAFLAGAGVALAAYKTEPGLIAPILFGAVTTGLHIAAFGIDPMRDKGMEGNDQFQQNRVAKAVDEAEGYLSEMSDATLRAGDRTIERRVEQFQKVARDLFRTVEEDPRDLTAAKKYMSVYLMGARDATAKFADIYSRSGDAQAKADYISLLDDLEQNFAARNEKMLLEDRSDLTVEIDVLKERLEREGVRLD